MRGKKMSQEINKAFWSRKTLLVIGGGVMQSPLIKEALALGINVAVMDSKSEAVGMQLVKQSNRLVADISQVDEAVDSALIFHRSRHPIDRVIAVATDFTYTVSAIADKLSLTKEHLILRNALAASNKIVQRKRFAKHNIKQPQFFAFTQSQFQKFLYKYFDKKNNHKGKRLPFDLPCVVKPSDSMGARGVVKVSEISALPQAMRNALAYSRSGELIVEQYIEADEFSIDALIFQKKVFITGIADRIIDKPPYFVEIGHVMPTQANATTIDSIEQAFKKAILSLGITHGGAKGDIRVKANGDVYIGEVAARLSGGFMSTHTYPYATGVNLMMALLHLTFGIEPSGLLVHKWSKKVMDVGIIPQEGKVVAIEGVQALRRLSGVRDVFMRCRIGDTIAMPKNNMMKAANVLIEANSYKKLFALASLVRATLQITTKAI